MICKDCEQDLHINKFNEQCRTCRRCSHLHTRYKITYKEYIQKLTDQGFRCAICQCNLLKMTSKQYTVDHDHDTGKFRGILCRSCNQGLAYWGENPKAILRLRNSSKYFTRCFNDYKYETLIRAVEYLLKGGRYKY